MTSLKVTGLVAGYGSAPPVLEGLDLEVGSSQIVALLGPNGTGKTTLLKVLIGLLEARRGTVALDGKTLSNERPERRLGLGLALVPEGRRLFTSLSVMENLRAGALSTGGRAEIDRVFALFPRLKERLEVRAGSLSGGEQQMLAVARAVLARPSVLLIDEPSLGLAPMMSRTVFDALRALADEGTSVLLAEQNLHLALSIADRALVLSAGRTHYEGDCVSDEDKEQVSDAYRSVTQLGAA